MIDHNYQMHAIHFKQKENWELFQFYGHHFE